MKHTYTHTHTHTRTHARTHRDPGRWGKRATTPNATLSHQNDPCIQMGSDENHFNEDRHPAQRVATSLLKTVSQSRIKNILNLFPALSETGWTVTSFIHSLHETTR